MSNAQFQQIASGYEGQSNLNFRGLPDACPHCRRGQSFPFPFIIRKTANKFNCYAFFQCLFTDCRTPFFGHYKLQSGDQYYLHGTEVPSYAAPMEEIPKVIDQISPNYRIIYTQAHQAEEAGLDLIAGCGYRKALEFLTKDYCILLTKKGIDDSKLSPEMIETIAIIKVAPLGMVINTYLPMPRVKALASRATWLGNDETHYERRIENGDITIMKSLMKLVIHFIEAEEEAKNLEAEIQPAK